MQVKFPRFEENMVPRPQRLAMTITRVYYTIRSIVCDVAS